MADFVNMAVQSSDKSRRFDCLLNSLSSRRRLGQKLGGAILGLLAGFCATSCLLADQITAKDIIERRRLSDLRLSPDGQKLLYSVATANIENNNSASTWWMRVVSEDSATMQANLEGSAIEWQPNSAGVAYVDGKGSVQYWDLATQNSRLLLDDGRISGLFPNETSARVNAIFWAPDGKSLALAVTLIGKMDQQPMTGVEVDIDWWFNFRGAPASVVNPISHATLIRLDIVSGALTKMLPEGFNLQLSGRCADWSPDSKQLVISTAVGRASRTDTMNYDLYIISSDNNAPRPLVIQPGWDRDAVWSPDGKRIAFLTQAGTEDWTYESQIGVVDIASGKVTYPAMARSEDPRARTGSLAGWSTDGNSLYFATRVHLSVGTFAMNWETGKIEDLALRPAQSYGSLSKARGADALALIGTNINEPADAFYWEPGLAQPRRLTDLNPNLRNNPFCDVEEVSWPSPDGKWQLHGFLLTPHNAGKDTKLPMIASVVGGPNMVPASYDSLSVFQYPWPLFVQNGFAVFFPNTRGREGYGSEFRHDIATVKSMNRIPSEDVLSGVEMLVREGRADPDRLAIQGWSYGYAVAAYCITETDRFKAASLGEGIAEFLTSAIAAESWGLNLMRQMYGMGTPANRDDLSLLIDESPGYRTERIKTPCLLEYGIQAHAAVNGRNFYNALRYHNGTAEFIIYPRSAHGWSEPKLVLDSFNRNIEWFEYWVQGVASERMIQRYGPTNVPSKK